MSLTFNEERHEYAWEGKIVPSVTQVLSSLNNWSHIPEGVMVKARAEGQAIHAMVQYETEGTLDEANLPEWLRPFLAAWRKFKDDTGFAVDGSEKRVFHAQYKYAGTADLFGRAPKLPKLKGRGIVDLKRSAYDDPITGCQLAGYAAAEDTMQPDTNMRIRWRAGLKLQKDGNYRLQVFESNSDWGTFLACLTVHRWLQEHRT